MANKRKIAIIGLKGLPAFGGAAAAGEHVIEQLANEYDFTIYATASHTSHRGLYKGANQIVFKRFPIRSLNVLYYYIRSAFACCNEQVRPGSSASNGCGFYFVVASAEV